MPTGTLTFSLPEDDAELNEAEKICAAASPGPWHAVMYQTVYHGMTSYIDLQKDRDFIAASRTLVPRLATELKAAREKLARIQAVVDQQAKDEGLWGQAFYRVDAFHQEALRKLHEVIEGKSIRVGVGDDSRN